jgi:hypothetical protein
MSSRLRTIGCKVGLHKWEPVIADVSSAHHRCFHCHKTKHVDPRKPPDSHSSDGYLYRQ